MSTSYSKEFNRAAIGLLLNIIQKVNPEDSKKYFKFLKKELNINFDEFEAIKEYKEFIRVNTVIEQEIDTVREALEYKRHRIMKFLMMLNRCIIIDGCDMESYRRFEKIRDGFLKKL